MSTTVGMISLGCPKNQVDAEIMLSLLAEAGFELSHDAAQCDAVIVNTCGFIDASKSESIETVLELAALKKNGILKAVIVTGCLAERYRQDLLREMPEADAVIGIGANSRIVKAVRDALAGANASDFGEKTDLPLGGGRVISTPGYYAYLKVADGCDNCCSYCAIPMIRGPFRSRLVEDIADEAELLAASGVKEINLVAQDTTRYGEDIYGKPELPRLLRRLCEIDGVRWLRVMYCYPERMTDELIDVFATEQKLVKYIDMPIQHISKRILKRMNRAGDREAITTLLKKLRERIRGVVIRTAFIAGFPGETKQEFEELCDFIREARFERAGCFAYSREEGTKAAIMGGQHSEEIKSRRADIIMETQMDVALGISRLMRGRTLDVLVEGRDGETGLHYGRSYMDAPDIDTRVYFESRGEPLIGGFSRVKITGAQGYDLLGAEEK